MKFFELLADQLGIMKEPAEELKETDNPIAMDRHITPKEFKDTYGKMLTRQMQTKEELRMVIYIQTDKGTRFYTIKELQSYDDNKITFLDKNGLPMTFYYTSIVGISSQK